MAEPLTFEALVSSEYVLSTAENFVVYVLLEAVARIERDLATAFMPSASPTAGAAARRRVGKGEK